MLRRQKHVLSQSTTPFACTLETRFAPVQPHFALVQPHFRSLGSKDLLHPLLTTLGNLPFSGSLPELSDCKARGVPTPKPPTVQESQERTPFRGGTPCPFPVPKDQQFAYGVVSEGFWRKVCGNSAESSRKFAKKCVFFAPGKGAEILRKFRVNLRKFSAMTPKEVPGGGGGYTPRGPGRGGGGGGPGSKGVRGPSQKGVPPPPLLRSRPPLLKKWPVPLTEQTFLGTLPLLLRTLPLV